jgi:uncharacterized protein (DUF433 family)
VAKLPTERGEEDERRAKQLPRPHRWRKTPYIKGRNLPVWHLLCSMWANKMTPEEVAQDYELPVEAVYEALDYYEKHRELLEAEAEEEREWLRQHGINL